MTKFISMLSGGIDSPVATYLIMKKGYECIAVHFDNKPFSDDIPLNKTKKLVEMLSKKTGKKIKLYVVPHGKNQSEFVKRCERKFTCIFCRRMQYRISEELAKKEGAEFIVTGEALGQKASQTIDNLYVTDSSIDMPVVRPLIGMDKEDIIKISRKIGIFEESSISTPCCTIVPDKPSTSAKIKKIEEEESKINIKQLVQTSLAGAVHDTF